jgi:hypothetical protein
MTSKWKVQTRPEAQDAEHAELSKCEKQMFLVLEYKEEPPARTNENSNKKFLFLNLIFIKA